MNLLAAHASVLTNISKGVAVDAIGKMADTFQLMVESEQTEAQGQKYSTAEGNRHKILLIIL